MDTDVQLTCFCLRVGLGKGCIIMAALKPVEGAVMTALQSQFELEISASMILPEQIKDARWDTVGPGADSEADDIVDGQGLVVE